MAMTFSFKQAARLQEPRSDSEIVDGQPSVADRTETPNPPRKEGEKDKKESNNGKSGDDLNPATLNRTTNVPTSNSESDFEALTRRLNALKKR
jgi:hypothetical protein